MSFSGGVFSINTSGQPVVAGTSISASVFNLFSADIATGLSTCMLKDGTQTATAGIGFYAGAVGLPGIYLGTDTTTGWYRIGLNNPGFAVAGVKMWGLSAEGGLVQPLQPLFNAANSVSDANVTGDGTLYTIICNTEVTDQNADYDNATGVFTAPVTGSYLFSYIVQLTSLGAGHTEMEILVAATSRNYQTLDINPANINVAGSLIQAGAILVDMAATNTCSLQVRVTGSTKTVAVNTGTKFQGYLVA